MNKSDHIFITGATGFLGSYIVKYALSQGYHNITCLKRSNSKMDLIGAAADQVTWVEGDLFSYELLRESLLNVDFIIHSAAMISFVKSEFENMRKVNVEGTSNLLNAALEIGRLKQFLHVSSVAAFGRSEKRTVINEQCDFENTKMDTGYGHTKHLSDLEVFRAGEEGLPISFIHPSMIMGAGDWNVGTSRLIQTVAKGLHYYPMGSSGFVDVRDVAKMSIRILKQGYKNERLLCCGESMPIKSMIELICKNLNCKEPKRKLNKTLIAIAWRGEWLRSKLLGRKPLITKETLLTSSTGFEFDNSKSIRDLDFVYRSLNKTIEETCELYKRSFKNNGTLFTLDF